MVDPGSLNVFALSLSLAFATLASEDLACIAAGVLVAEGQIGFLPAVVACFAGIVGGDLLVYVAGRLFGRRVLAWSVLRRRISAETLDRSSRWLGRRGAIVVLTTRFVPGTRVATYLAAGLLRTDARSFAAWLTLAAALWTPALVGATAIAGRQFAEAARATGTSVALAVGGAVVALLFLTRLPGVLRRLLAGRRLFAAWRRATRWEYWPIWIFYLPVLAYIVRLMVAHRSMTAFAAVNPGIPGGGFVGESKFDILRNLSGGADVVARATLLPADLGPAGRVWAARQFMRQFDLRFPVVVKPDRGQRGSGVTIVKSEGELAARLGSCEDVIVQEYAAGYEFGVFYVRHPAWPRGRIFSITDKRFPELVGDGRRTVAQLIVADDRAVCQASLHRRVHAHRLQTVLADGERLPIVEVGSHCRGALFLDATAMRTTAMEEAFDRVARRFDGFCFGRFDVRTPSIADFRRGGNFKIVELNGVTSEATHIYDPANGLGVAYAALFEQWRLAFEIGAANLAGGARATRLRDLAGMALSFWRARRATDCASVTGRSLAASNELGVRA